MPIRISSELPAFRTLREENIFVMSKERAEHQDIRPLKVIIVNIMPKKIETESQLMRLLSNTPIQVDIDLIQMASHISKNTSKHHLEAFYKKFDEIKDNRYDGMIVTGAPVELLEYEQVDYWNIRHYIYVGQLRQDCIIISECQNIYLIKKCSEFFRIMLKSKTVVY